MADESDVLDAQEAAAYLRINVQTIRRLAREKRLPGFRVGSVWRFKKRSLDRWAELQHARPTRRSILVVDDEEPVLRACVRALREIPGAEIVQQKLSSRAAELLASQSFDLLVSDVRMPEMSGVELIRIAHECDPTLPVILITGFPTPEMAANKNKFDYPASGR